MKNVYDIRYEKKLTYILPENVDASANVITKEKYRQVAVILYLYYLDTLPIYYKYIDGIQNDIDVYIISSQENVLDEVRKHVIETGRTNISYRLKENNGRDISALLIESRCIIERYALVCFVHDKKERREELKKDTDLWIENLWGNLIGGSKYIDNVLRLFEGNQNIGILAPPDPIGDYFSTWYGYGWHGSFEITKELKEKLHLKADINPEKPPITIGTALWFRSKALQKLFDMEWKYTDFDDRQLKESNYLSYGIERIFAYVAQDAGYDTGEIMSISYAQKQNNYLHYATAQIMGATKEFFPIPTIAALEDYKRNLPQFIEFARKNERLFLYGAGIMGKFCANLLRRENIKITGFIVSGNIENSLVSGVEIFSLKDMDDLYNSNMGVVITALDESVRKEMIKNLENKGIINFIEFWK